jgi:hypothetical protein
VLASTVAGVVGGGQLVRFVIVVFGQAVEIRINRGDAAADIVGEFVARQRVGPPSGTGGAGVFDV